MSRDSGDVLKESDRLLLARLAPVSVLVSPEMSILQYRGDVGPYISPLPGKASLNLLKLLGNGPQVAVRAAILQAKRDETAVRKDGVRIRSASGASRTVAIEVIPVKSGGGGYLVLFEEPGVPRSTSNRGHAPPRSDAPSSPSTAGSDVERLSKELDETRDYLQSIIEQQEAAHEELQSAYEEVQSANEELQSVNEELETSKEEVQSSNEELSTVNGELQHRNNELGRSNSDLTNLLDSTHLPVVFVGRDLRVRRYTPMAERVLNLTPMDLGRRIGDVKTPADLPELEPRVVRAIDTLKSSEQQVRDTSGRWYTLRVRPYRTLDNQIDGAVVVLNDIDAVMRARLYAERIIATVREPLLVLDGEIRVVSANAAFYQTFCTEPPATVGRRLYDLGDREWDIPELRRLLEQALPTSELIADFQITREFAGIGRKALMLSARVLAPSPEEPPLILVAFEDVTERQHVDDLRRQRVTELAAADVSKNEYLAMLAHELRNPLAPMRTAAHLLGQPGIPAPVAEKARLTIDRQIGIMTRLIDDLLDVGRVTQGKFEFQMASVDLNAILRRALELVQHHVEERQQEVSLALPAETLRVRADATRLEQAFGNLLNNASKFTPRAGRIWISVEANDASAAAGDAVVHIRDEGIGIGADVLPHVFELFKQAGHSPHHAPGLGVGLALVRQIVAVHGGRVSVQSPGTGQGSEFVVSLPLLDDAENEDAPAPTERDRPADHGPRRILIVDDNVDAAESLAALLMLRGHEVRVAHDGQKGLDAAGTFRPQIVFLDIAMPGMSGYAVARDLRQRAATRGAILVALTGFGRDVDRRLAAEAGFDAHVTKPLDPKELPALLTHRRSKDQD